MKSHSKEYKNKVYSFLDKGIYGATYTIDNICAKENQAVWIAIVKQYMNETDFQGGYEFSNDYKKLKRVDLNFEKSANVIGFSKRNKN